MSQPPVNIDLDPHTRGDKWPGIPVIGPVVINGAQPDEVLSRVRMQFRKGNFVFSLDSNDGALVDAPILIVDEQTWKASIPVVHDFLPDAGDWDWDMEFYAGADTAPLTFYKGILTVNQDVTK